jgi:acyl-CoA thioester hydrolase
MNEAAPDALLSTWRGEVLAEWTDYNGHLNDACYMVIFSHATDGLMERVGLDSAGRAATGHSIFTLESHINYLNEVRQGVAVAVRTQILGADAKRMDVYHTLHRAADGELLAANQQMLLNVDMATRRSAPFAPQVAPRVQALVEGQRGLQRPPYAGRSIALPQR